MAVRESITNVANLLVKVHDADLKAQLQAALLDVQGEALDSQGQIAQLQAVVSVETILAVATIVGGIAAVWFFHEKLSRFYQYIYGRVFNDGFPRDYSETDKQWCNDTQKMWERIPFKGHYIAWDGPLEFMRLDGDAPWSDEHIATLKRHCEFDLKYAMPFRVDEYKDKGFSQLFETDCRTWRHEILDRNQFVMMFRAKDKPTKGLQRIVNKLRALKTQTAPRAEQHNRHLP